MQRRKRSLDVLAANPRLTWFLHLR